MPKPPKSGILVLVAGILMMLVLGSVHAFSVFLEPLETRFDASRSQVSLTYSLALVCLTGSVLFGHLVFRRMRPDIIGLVVCLFAAIGCFLAATANNLAFVWLGYSIFFGTANGLGYAFALQSSAQANSAWKGLAIGIITGAYAIGATVSPIFFRILLDMQGFSGAMTGLAVILLVFAPIVWALLIKARVKLVVSTSSVERKGETDRRLVITLWIGYGTAVTSGLMAIGHATGIARTSDLSDELIFVAPIAIAAFNMMGSLLGGLLADRFSLRYMLIGIPLLSALTLFMLASFGSGLAVLTGLSIIGFTYGAIISIYPAAISTVFGAVAGVRIYGMVFTAWGMAGLLGPFFAGLLYEKFGNYQIALVIAGCAGIVSLLAIMTFRWPDESRQPIKQI